MKFRRRYMRLGPVRQHRSQPVSNLIPAAMTIRQNDPLRNEIGGVCYGRLPALRY